MEAEALEHKAAHTHLLLGNSVAGMPGLLNRTPDWKAGCAGECPVAQAVRPRGTPLHPEGLQAQRSGSPLRRGSCSWSCGISAWEPGAPLAKDSDLGQASLQVLREEAGAFPTQPGAHHKRRSSARVWLGTPGAGGTPGGPGMNPGAPNGKQPWED